MRCREGLIHSKMKYVFQIYEIFSTKFSIYQIRFLFTQTLNVASWTVESVTNFVGANTKLELKLHDLADLLNRIQTQDDKMQSYVSNYHDLERFTLEGFAQWITAQDTMSVQGLLERIHLLATGSLDLENIGNVGVLQLLADQMEVIDENIFLLLLVADTK